MRGTSQMDRASVKTAWVGGIYPGLVSRTPGRSVGAVERAKGGRGESCESLTARIDAFFDANPTEELTARDARVKFAASSSSVERALAELCGEEKITRILGRPIVYLKEIG